MLLLVLGVGLLAIAAGFFLVYAWFTFDLVWRALSTVAITLVAVVGASWLRRAQLRAAAEGVAALAASLIVLDAWAASALGLFGLDRVDQALYWGCALIVLTLVFETWARLTALRFPAIAASIAIAPGVGLLAAGVAGVAGEGATRFAIGAVGAAIGALAHLAWRRRPRSHDAAAASRRGILPFAAVLRHASSMDRTTEITIVAIVGLLSSAASLIALMLPFASPSLDSVRPWAFVALAAATTGQACLLPTHARPRWLAALAVPFAPIAVISLLATPIALSAAGAVGQVWAALAAAIALALPAFIDLLRARLAGLGNIPVSRACTAALITALVGAGAVVAASLLINRPLASALLARASGALADDPAAAVLEAPWTAEGDGLAIGLVAGLVAAGALAWRPAQRRRRVAPYWTAAAIAGLTYVSWQARSPVLVQASLILCLAVLLVALIATLRARGAAAPHASGRDPLRLVLWAGAGVVAWHLVSIGAVHAHHQLVSAIAVVSALFAARFAVTPRVPGGTSYARVALTAGAALTALAAAVTAPRLWAVDAGVELPLGSTLAVVISGAAFSAAAGLLPHRALAGVERVAIVVAATFPGALAAAIGTLRVAAWHDGSSDGPLPQQVSALVVTALLAAAVVAGSVTQLRAVTDRAPAGTPRLTAGAWMLPVLAIVVWAPVANAVIAVGAALGGGFHDTGARLSAVVVTLAIVALASAGVSLGVRRAGGAAATLWRLDAPALGLMSIAVVTLAGRSLWRFDGSLAVGLALAAGTVVLVAANGNGLVGAPGRRKHAGWPAVPLACAAWLAFVGTWPGTPTVEIWWLPVGGILVATGLTVWWFGRTLRGTRRAVVGPLLIAAGALAGGIPIAAVGAEGASPMRAAALGAVAAAAILLLTAPRLSPFIAEVAAPVTGALAGIITASAALRVIASAPETDGELHAAIWLTPMLLVLAIAATFAARSGLMQAARSWHPAPAISLVFAASVAIGSTLLTTRTIGPAGAAAALALVAVIGSSLPPLIALRPALAAVVPFATGAALPLAFASAFGDPPPSLGLLVTATLVLTVANAAVGIRLRHEHPALSAPVYAMLPVALFAVLVSTLQFETLAPLARAFPSAAVAGAVALTAAVAVAVVDLMRSDGKARSWRLPRLAVDAGAVTTVVTGFAVAGAFAARFDALNWAFLGAVFVAASATPKHIRGAERIARRVARWVGTPIVAIAAGAAVRDLWPAAPSSLVVVVTGASVLSIGVGVALLAHRSAVPAATSTPATNAVRPRASVEGLVEIGAGALVGLVGSVLVDAFAPSGLVTHLVVAVVAALSLTIWASGILPRNLAAYGVCLAAPAGLALALLPVVRSAASATANTTTISALAPELSGAPVLVALVGTAWLATLRTSSDGAPADRLRSWLARALTVAAVTSVTLSCVIAIDGTQWWRGTAWICVLAVIALTAHTLDRAPFDRSALIASAVGVGLVTIASLATDGNRHVEQLTVPLGIAAVVFGAIVLARRQRSSSWAMIAPGVAVLILPSFFAQFTDDAPLWRIVGVGLAALAALVWGLTGRLQAPFLLGLVLTIAQAITAFWIALDSANRDVPWWIWLAVAGVVLLALAIRFEASLRDARKSAATIRAMR
ncbi:hypothetical protein GCM10011490_28530 [Pseudoclavibacter endophyticus]|nr:hypothetical protein GCM10011490_28530 [Pseudoclavibacter endophyticus]